MLTESGRRGLSCPSGRYPCLCHSSPYVRQPSETRGRSLNSMSASRWLVRDLQEVSGGAGGGLTSAHIVSRTLWQRLQWSRRPPSLRPLLDPDLSLTCDAWLHNHASTMHHPTGQTQIRIQQRPKGGRPAAPLTPLPQCATHNMRTGKPPACASTHLLNVPHQPP